MAATDSYRLSVKQAPLPGSSGEAQAIVPARALAELARIGSRVEGEGLDVGIQENQVLFGLGGVWLSARRIDGQFPNYRQLRPTEFGHEVELAKDELVDVVRRTSLMAQRNAPVRLSFAEGSLTLTAQSQDVGEARESLPVEFPRRRARDRLQPGVLARRCGEHRGRHRAAEADQPAAARSDPGRWRGVLVPDHANQAPLLGLHVEAVRGTNFRCYRRLELALQRGLIGVVGPNGAGKTALVELVHFGALGYSPRTSADQHLIRLGEEVLRTELGVAVAGGRSTVQIGFRPGEPKRVTVDGARERSVERLLGRFPVLVFTPDRLRLVQGAPALRRAYFDRVLARLWPRLAAAPAEFGRRLAQRNHLLKRVRAGAAGADALDPWDVLLAEAGAELISFRARLCARLTGPLARRMEELGGSPDRHPLQYLPNVEGDATALARELGSRRARDLERFATGIGPHLDDFALVDGGKDLRRYGSQGEQRRSLLALILAEADLLGEERSEQPLLLLDDVTSELDLARRTRLLEALAGFEQAIVTTTDESDLAGGATVLLRVDDGAVS